MRCMGWLVRWMRGFACRMGWLACGMGGTCAERGEGGKVAGVMVPR